MRPKALALGCAAVATALVLSGCGSDAASGGKTKLTIGLFGNFGYAELLKEYAAAHPDVEISDRTASYSDHHKNLAAHLATSSGAADIEAVDTGYVNQFKATPDKFVDLNTKGGDQLKDRWLGWKWEASLSKDGKQIGYGTDIGGLAICYRRDLLQNAGLPADRDQVAALWPTWQDFMAAGKKFQEKAPEGVKWFDGGPTVLNAIVGQASTGYYDKTDKIVVGDNKEVKAAWDLVVDGVQSGLSSKLLYSTPVWNTGFKQGQFATVTCPAWQMAKIKDQAGAEAMRQVGRHLRARWWRQLGRLVPDGSQVGQERRQGRGAGGVADRARAAGQGVQERRASAVDPEAVRGPVDRRLQEPVLQRRADRQALHRRGQEAEPAVPGPEGR